MLLALAACSCASCLLQSKNFPVISLHTSVVSHVTWDIIRAHVSACDSQDRWPSVDIDPVPWTTLQLIYSDYEWRPQNTSLPLSDSKIRISTARYLHGMLTPICSISHAFLFWKLLLSYGMLEETRKWRDERFELQNQSWWSSSSYNLPAGRSQKYTACCCRIQPFHKETNQFYVTKL